MRYMIQTNTQNNRTIKQPMNRQIYMGGQVHVVHLANAQNDIKNNKKESKEVFTETQTQNKIQSIHRHKPHSSCFSSLTFLHSSLNLQLCCICLQGTPRGAAATTTSMTQQHEKTRRQTSMRRTYSNLLQGYTRHERT